MQNLTVTEIEQRWDELIEIVNTTFEGERKEKILKMYDFFETRMALSPASGRLVYHGAYAGGYLDHILNIVKVSKFLHKMYDHLGGILDFTMEELIFAVLHHDLGKIGDLEHEYYLPNDNDWAIKNKKEVFIINPKIHYMQVPHRSIWLLQHFGISMSQKEYLGIMLSDGVFDEGIKPYFTQYQEGKQLKTNLPYMVHWADWIATTIEKDRYRKSLSTDTGAVDRVKNALDIISNSEPDKPKISILANKYFGDNDIQSSASTRDTVSKFQTKLDEVFEGEEK